MTTETFSDYLTGDAIKQVDLVISGTGITQKDVLKKVGNLVHINGEMEMNQVLRASAGNLLKIKEAVWSLLTSN